MASFRLGRRALVDQPPSTPSFHSCLPPPSHDPGEPLPRCVAPGRPNSGAVGRPLHLELDLVIFINDLKVAEILYN